MKNDNFVGGPFPDFYHSTFHAPWYVHEHWGQYFSVAGYAARRSLGFQDFVLLERSDEPGSRRRLRPKVQPGVTPTPPPGGSLMEWARHSPVASPARGVVRRARRQLERRAGGSVEGGPPPGSGDSRVWEALRIQGERVNRLEADLWEAVRQIREDRSGRA